MSEPIRMVLLGKTGSGKSSLANTICGQELFTVNHTINSETCECKAITKTVRGRNLTVIDTPGLFDTDLPEENLKPAILRCITECAPGPHVFLIVLKVEKFTEHDQAVVEKICTYFSEDVLKYAMVVFTHGNQLPDGMQIEKFVEHHKLVSELVKKCGNRCSIMDNKYWNTNKKQEYRSNQSQMEKLLQTIDMMMRANNGSFYTNEMLQAEEEEKTQLLPGNLSEIREKAKKPLIRLTGIGVGVLLAAMFGVVVIFGAVLTVLQDSSKPVTVRNAAGKAIATAGVALGFGGTALAVGGVPLVSGLTGIAVAGALMGALIGNNVAEVAETPKEAASKTLEAVKKDTQAYLNRISQGWNKFIQPESETLEDKVEE